MRSFRGWFHQYWPFWKISRASKLNDLPKTEVLSPSWSQNLSVKFKDSWKVKGKMQMILLAFLVVVFILPFSSGDDNDENFYFANNNNKFVFNTRKNCQQNYYFDREYFKCRLCDPNFHLMSSARSKTCTFSRKFIFDLTKILFQITFACARKMRPKFLSTTTSWNARFAKRLRKGWHQNVRCVSWTPRNFRRYGSRFEWVECLTTRHVRAMRREMKTTGANIVFELNSSEIWKTIKTIKIFHSRKRSISTKNSSTSSFSVKFFINAAIAITWPTSAFLPTSISTRTGLVIISIVNKRSSTRSPSMRRTKATSWTVARSWSRFCSSSELRKVGLRSLLTSLTESLTWVIRELWNRGRMRLQRVI